MSKITKGDHDKKLPDDHAEGAEHLADEQTGMKHGVPAGATQEESHAGYGGTDRLQSESAPLHPGAGKDQARDI